MCSPVHQKVPITCRSRRTSSGRRSSGGMRRNGLESRETPSLSSRIVGGLTYPLKLVIHVGLLGVFVGSFAPLFTDAVPALATFESFLPHLTAVALILTLPALLFRPRWFALLGPIAVAWNIGTIWPYLPLDGSPDLGASGAVADAATAGNAGPVLKVVSANVWYRNDSFQAALNYFDASNADVIAVIEATPQWKIAL